MASTTYDLVLSVMNQPAEKRPDYLIDDIIPWFRKHFHLFKNLKTEIVFDLVKNAILTTKKTDEIIIKQGEKGDCMYTVLRGKVTVYIQYTKAEGEDKPIINPTQTTNKSELLRHQLGTFVCHIGPGDSFGEVALVEVDDMRTASVIAEEWSELIVIDRELYSRSISNVVKREFESKLRFIDDNQYFQKLMPKFRKQLAMAMKIKTLPYDAVLLKQGDNVEAIYYILNGEVKVSMDAQQHLTQYPYLFKHCPEQFLYTSPEDLLYASTINKPTRLCKSACISRNGLPHASMRRNAKKKSLEVCLLGQQESLGDIELLLDLKTYMQTAVCCQQTDVIELELKHYERLFSKRKPNHNILNSMRSGVDLRLETRLARLIPLLGRLRALQTSKTEGMRPHVNRFTHQEFQEEGRRIRSGDPDSAVRRSSNTQVVQSEDMGENRDSDFRKSDELNDYKEQSSSRRPGSVLDEKTCDRTLTNLETRMKSWLTNMSVENGHLCTEPRIAKLRRSDTPIETVKPGLKVVFRPKRAPISAPTSTDQIQRAVVADTLQTTKNNLGKNRLAYYDMALNAQIPTFSRTLTSQETRHNQLSIDDVGNIA